MTADDGDRAKTAFFAWLESRREDWALRMLRSAHVLKGAGNVDWNTVAATAKSVLDGRALETIPIMEVCIRRGPQGALQRTRIGHAVDEARSGSCELCGLIVLAVSLPFPWQEFVEPAVRRPGDAAEHVG
ncbi:MAG: hypothetical protein OXG51_01660, partial [Gammaproteobacteria bacterium]|nr:hypothetical protein [Gammaproteobacteria bacterium]